MPKKQIHTNGYDATIQRYIEDEARRQAEAQATQKKADSRFLALIGQNLGPTKAVKKVPPSVRRARKAARYDAIKFDNAWQARRALEEAGWRQTARAMELAEKKAVQTETFALAKRNAQEKRATRPTR